MVGQAIGFKSLSATKNSLILVGIAHASTRNTLHMGAITRMIRIKQRREAASKQRGVVKWELADKDQIDADRRNRTERRSSKPD